jgi:putative PIN family toxin of toxin-antitoxin system
MPRSRKREKRSAPSVVLDTNVLVSGLLNSVSPTGKILALFPSSGLFNLLVSNEILGEYETVLARRACKTRLRVLEKVSQDIAHAPGSFCS